MGDRCHLTIQCHPDDEAKLINIIGEEPDGMLQEEGQLTDLCYEQANYGFSEELEAATQAGVRFTAYNGAGESYGPGWTVGYEGQGAMVNADFDGNITVTYPLVKSQEETAKLYLHLSSLVEGCVKT